MNYSRIYDNLITRAKSRIIYSYTERHHIVPRCMGGTDDAHNLVDLTPEEHYLAHQLLVKIHPQNDKLIFAASMMISNRPTNKMYGWLRRRFQLAVSKQQRGSGNSQYGSRWVHSLDLKVSKKIKKCDPLPLGWHEGRKIHFEPKPIKQYACGICGTMTSRKKFCSASCKNKTNIKLTNSVMLTLFEEHKAGKSISKCLKDNGFDGTGQNFLKFKEFCKVQLGL